MRRLLARLQSHITTVVGRYRGRIGGWDVVNEALDEDGTLRRTPWLDAIGEDYIAKAFEFAHAADPDAELYYNDYNLWKPAKRDAADPARAGPEGEGPAGRRDRRAGPLGHRRAAAPGDRRGARGHPRVGYPAAHHRARHGRPAARPRHVGSGPRRRRRQIRAATNIYPDGLPAAMQQRLARRYADVFALFLKHDVGRATFWG